ncbi:MAG TPA: hypothetical protein VFL12_02465 [Thermoanaerobaculia bacterium]|nr:hypothetical protein [Thermoanaerobaculia bacterium]
MTAPMPSITRSSDAPGSAASRGEAFWREHLAGLDGAFPELPFRAEAGNPEAAEECARVLSSESSRRLAIFAAESGISIPSLAQSAWALLLSRHADAAEVVFEATDGAPPAPSGSQRRIPGSRTPVIRRLRVPAAERVIDWLAAVQADRDRLRLLPHASLAEIRRWAGWDDETSVESRLEHREFARGPAAGRAGSDPPVVLRLEVNPTLRARLSWNASRGPRSAMERLLERFLCLIERLAAHPERAVADVDVLTPEERRTALVVWNRTERP